MQKIFFSMATSLLLLTACSTEEQADDLFNKAVEANEKIENLEVDMVINQQVSGDNIPSDVSEENSKSLDGVFPTTTTSTTKLQIEPLVLHQTIQVMGTPIEMYYSEQGLFTQKMNEDTWYKIDSDELGLLSQRMDEIRSQTPDKQLDNFKEYLDEFSYEEHEDRYVLHLNASDLNIEKLLREQLGTSMLEELFTDEMMEAIAINQLNYEITLDKSTYYVSSISTELDMTITDNGEETSISQKIDRTYTKYNELEDLKVPEEIITDAEPF
ncbi:DUF6612 family protein [Paraliobacillus sp. JSM ZJ581]|uniref:DUF6612 family protein n=1 Tax=Paraliobacillus sp. JSM ZJ581 TaxID=3342118 RepID=UPI0035A92B6D